jgi:hypothetical protein
MYQEEKKEKYIFKINTSYTITTARFPYPL